MPYGKAGWVYNVIGSMFNSQTQSLYFSGVKANLSPKFCPLMVAALEETYCNVWHGSSRPAEIYTMSLKNEVEESCRSVDMVREPASKLDQKYSAL